MSEKERAEDEISLVDLLAVLIRFRRMIVGGTVLVFLAALGWFYLVPARVRGEAPPQPTWTASMDLEITAVPAELQSHITVSPLARAQALFADPRVAGQDLSTSHNRNTGLLTVTLEREAESTASADLTAAIRAVEELLSARIREDLTLAEERITARVATVGDQLQAIVDSTAPPAPPADALTADQILRYLSLSITMEKAVQTFREDADLLEQVRLLGARSCYLCPTVEEPLLTRNVPGPTGGRRSVRVVVATMAALFLLVFLAFVRQYIRTVRQDQEESRKLRDAWEGR